MKVLFMEKFDDSGSHIGATLGRDSRLNITATFPTKVLVNPVTGLSYSESTPTAVAASGMTPLINRFELGVTGIDTVGKKISIKLNGLSFFNHLESNNPGSSWGTSTLVTTLHILGKLVSSNPQVATNKLPSRAFNSTLGNIGDETVDLEIVIIDGEIKIYCNNILTQIIDGYTNEDIGDIFKFRADGWWYNGWYGASCPRFYLKELIVTELDEYQERLGSVRIVRTPLRSETNTELTKDGEMFNVTSPELVEHEQLLATNIRLGARSTMDSHLLDIELLGRDDEVIHTDRKELHLTHNRDTSCILVPSDSVNESEHKAGDLKLSLKAGEL